MNAHHPLTQMPITGIVNLFVGVEIIAELERGNI